MAQLLAAPATLRRVITYHILPNVPVIDAFWTTPFLLPGTVLSTLLVRLTPFGSEQDCRAAVQAGQFRDLFLSKNLHSAGSGSGLHRTLQPITLLQLSESTVSCEP